MSIALEVELPRCGIEELALAALRGDDVRVRLSPSTTRATEQARRRYLEEASHRRVYGYCTGLGDLAHRSQGECPPDWEERVIEEHSVQAGPEAPPGIVRLFLLVRLNQLLRLPAPVRPVVAERLADAINRGITPVVHTRGSVGASGDLSPSAQAVRCLYYGRGEALLNGKRVNCGDALQRSGLGVLPLEAGEALFLINNTAWSTALCMASGLALRGAVELLVEHSRRAARLVGASREHYEPGLLRAKMCPEGAVVAERILPGASSEPRTLQAPYSVRCAPQILGASRRAVSVALEMLEEEACASTENPSIVERRVLHGCNFHAVKVSYACALLKAAAGYLSAWAERLAAQLLRGSQTGAPDYLAGPGSTVGLMIVHYTMAALSARIRGLSGLEMLYNTPTSGLQEDIVSMAPAMAEATLEQARDLAGMAGLLGLLLDKAEAGDYGPHRGLQEGVWEAYWSAVQRLAPWLASGAPRAV